MKLSRMVEDASVFLEGSRHGSLRSREVPSAALARSKDPSTVGGTSPLPLLLEIAVGFSYHSALLELAGR